MRYRRFLLVLALAAGGCGEERKTLGTNKVACTSLQDWVDMLSMNGKGDAGAAVVLGKILGGQCKSWTQGTVVVIEKHETRKSGSGENVDMACARRVDAEENKCSWIMAEELQSAS